MLDETPVVVLSEMGRTPTINGRAGRDHWVGALCALFAGAGVRPGVVHGWTDRIASAVTKNGGDFGPSPCPAVGVVVLAAGH